MNDMNNNDDLELVFVYAGDSGLFNSLLHYAQKIIAPQTYECQLCMLTSGALGTEKAWTQFLKELALPVAFLHRDELSARHPGEASTALPIIYAQRGQALAAIVSAQEIEACADLQTLIALVRTRVDAARGPSSASTSSIEPARQAS